jgi:4'-phosphopantetheinyl transferase EntD
MYLCAHGSGALAIVKRSQCALLEIMEVPDDSTLPREAMAQLCSTGIAYTVEMAKEGIEAFSEKEAQFCATFADSRRAEFLTGRQCARRALAQFGEQAKDLPADSEGLPKWPDGMTGSITHSRGLCGAVVADLKTFSAIGLDFEQTNRLKSRAAKRVVHPLEADFSAENPDHATVLFSLKEAFYKAQYPHWQVKANFKDLGLTVDRTSGTAAIAYLDADLKVRLGAAADRFNFRFAIAGNYVVSLCWLSAVS